MNPYKYSVFTAILFRPINIHAVRPAERMQPQQHTSQDNWARAQKISSSVKVTATRKVVRKTGVTSLSVAIRSDISPRRLGLDSVSRNYYKPVCTSATNKLHGVTNRSWRLTFRGHSTSLRGDILWWQFWSVLASTSRFLTVICCSCCLQFRETLIKLSKQRRATVCLQSMTVYLSQLSVRACPTRVFF